MKLDGLGPGAKSTFDHAQQVIIFPSAISAVKYAGLWTLKRTYRPAFECSSNTY